MQRTLLFRVSTRCLPKDDRSSTISVFVMFALLTLAALPALAKGTPAARPVPPQTAQAAPSPLIPTMEQEIEREMSYSRKGRSPRVLFGLYIDRQRPCRSGRFERGVTHQPASP